MQEKNKFYSPAYALEKKRGKLLCKTHKPGKEKIEMAFTAFFSPSTVRSSARVSE